MFLTPLPMADILLLAMVAVVACHMWWQYRAGRWMVLDPLNAFYGGVLICYIFEPIAYYDALRNWYSESVFIWTLVWILWGLIWVIIGYELPWGPKWGRKLPNFPRHLQVPRLAGAGLALIALGLASYVYQIFTVPGGLAGWLSVARGGTAYTEAVGYFYQLDVCLPVGIVILLWNVELHRAALPVRWFTWILGILMWCWFVYLGSRSRTVIQAMTLMTVFYIPRRRNPGRIVLITGLVVLFLITSFQGHYRSLFTNLSLNLEQVDWAEAQEKILPSALGGRRDQLATKGLGDLEINCVMAVVNLVPDRVDYNYGYTLLELATHGIPRQLWRGKIYPLYEAQTPVMREGNLSAHLVETENSSFLTGPAFTYVGYWYHLGGPLALIFAGLFTGAFFRMIRTIYDRDPSSSGNMIVYSTLIYLGFSDLASTPFYWVFSLPLALIPLLVLLYWARERGPDFVELAPAESFVGT